MNFVDVLAFDAKTSRKTNDGYLAASVLCARTGIQDYMGSELGRPDLGVVKVFRPEAEVFSKDSLGSFAHKPVTNDHPTTAVDASNWKKLAVGAIGGEVARDGEMIRVPMVVMDASAIADVESGKRELSVGYTADIDWTPGETATGLHFDAVQKNIRANHLAIVDKARGGPALKIGDDAVPEIALKKITVDGLPFDVNDAAATIIERLLADKAGLKTEIAAAQTASAAAAATHSTAIAAKDAEIATLKTQVLDEAGIDARVKAKGLVADTAGKLVPGFKAEGLSVADIHKAIVTAKMPEASKGYTADQYATAFDTLASFAPKAGVTAVVGDAGAALRQAIIAGGGGVVSDAHAALQKSVEDERNAWKTPAKAA